MLNYLLDKFHDSELSQQIRKPEEHKSCLTCRLVSGSGIIGGGMYVAYASRNRIVPLQKYLMLALASGMN